MRISVSMGLYLKDAPKHRGLCRENYNFGKDQEIKPHILAVLAATTILSFCGDVGMVSSVDAMNEMLDKVREELAQVKFLPEEKEVRV